MEKISISGGKIISGGLTFAKGNKDTPIHLGRSGPYQQKIHFARNIYVVLYDIRERRGWLVDGASALLHIARAQLSCLNYCDNVKISDFCHADPKGGSNAAQKVLTDPRNMRLAISEEVEVWDEITTGKLTEEYNTKRKIKKWCFEDLVSQTWSILEQIHDHQTKLLASSAIGLRGTDRDKLEGFGFRDIIEGENPLRPRVAILKSSGRGWVDLTRSIRSINLLGRGFGDLIRPAQDANKLCTYWKEVPKGKDYLTTSIPILQEICTKYGDIDADPLEIVQDIYWHKPDVLFESCECKSDRKHIKCDRVQVLLPPSIGSKKHPRPFQTQEGAVIFGRSKRFRWTWPNIGDPKEGAFELDEEDEEHDDNLRDSGIGTSVDTSSSADPSGSLGSHSQMQSLTLGIVNEEEESTNNKANASSPIHTSQDESLPRSKNLTIRNFISTQKAGQNPPPTVASTQPSEPQPKRRRLGQKR